jgi:alpha-tubulin suppressor-like RCC1 family protein
MKDRNSDATYFQFSTSKTNFLGANRNHNHTLGTCWISGVYSISFKRRMNLPYRCPCWDKFAFTENTAISCSAHDSALLVLVSYSHGSSQLICHSAPRPPPPLSGVTAIAIALGNSHTCAIMISGLVKCWGSNENGQLGIGSTSDQFSPADVPG